MLEIGRESVYGEASDELLAEAAEELVKEATDKTPDAAARALFGDRTSTMRERASRRRRGFVADLSGALFWEEQRLLIVSDLHLEKGSSYAARGVLLPPYDTVATLSRFAAVIARHDPRTVIALGDSFHDRTAHDRLRAPDREAIATLQVRRDWIWISGNHDPALPSDLGGVVAGEVAIGRSRFATSRPVPPARSPAICIRRRGSRPVAAPWSGGVLPATANAP